MAEVTGDLGGQPIQLNNAATEATLRELLVTVIKQGITGKGGKAQKELEKKLRELAEQTEALTDEQKEALKTAKSIEKRKQEELKQAKELGEAYRGLLDAALGAITGMTNLVSTLSRLDNSMTAAAQSMSAIPIVGNTLATVFGAVTGAAERTYKAFQQAASVGANFGGSITDMINAASGAGLTFDQFSGIVSRTGSDLALLGGSTAEGAKRLAQLGKQIRQTPLGDDLARLGYTTEQINESMAKYSGIIAKTGALEGMTNTQLVAQTGQYLQNLDAVSKLTGLNKKDLEEQRAQMMRDAQIRNTLRKMDATSQEELMAFLQTLPPELREGAKEVIATGTATSEAGKAALQYLPDAGRQFMQLNAQINQTGKFTRENNRALNASIQSEAKRVANSPLAENMRLYGDKYAQSVFVAIDDVAAQQKSIGTIQDETAKAAEERRKKEKENIDAANLKRFQEQIATVSNQFTALLANSNLLNDFFTIFKTMTDFVSTFVVPVFSFMAENAGLVAAVLTPLVAIVGLTKAAMAALTLQINLERIARRGGILAIIKMSMASLMAALPFAKFILIGGALVALTALIINNWEELIDWVQTTLNTLTFGRMGITKEEAARRKAERDARKQQEESNKVNKEGLNLQRQGVDLQREENAARQQGTSGTPTAAQPGGRYDLSTPQKMFESAMRRQQGAAAQPGAGTAVPAEMSSYLKTVALLESGGNVNAKAGTSSASGMFQFTEGTWKQMTKEMGKNYSLEDRFDPQKSAEVMSYFTQKQKGQLESGIGRSASSTDLYMAHFLGAGGATKFLNAMQQNPNALAADLDPKAAAANKSIFYDQGGRARTVAEVYQLMHGKVGKAEARVASGNVPQTVAALGSGMMATPSTSAAQTAVAQAPAPVTPPSPATTPQTVAQAPSQTQESPSMLLSSLNSKMDVLIALNRRANDTRDRQLSAAKVTAGEVTAYAAA